MQQKYFDHKPVKDGEGNIINTGPPKSLPPGVEEEDVQGQLHVRIGDLQWLTYDGTNYMEDINRVTRQPRFKDLYAHIKFWGEAQDSKGVYLKFQNALDASSGATTNEYSYNVRCPEQMFEQYLDDMGSLVIDFYDSETGYTMATSKAITNLFIKRRKRASDSDPLIDLRQTYAMTLIGDHTVKIGEYVLEIRSQFNSGFINQPFTNSANNQNQINNRSMQRQIIDLDNDDTFEANEQRARVLAEQMENRVASSLAGQPPSHQTYNRGRFAAPAGTPGNLITMEEYDQRPVRDRPNSKIQNSNLPGQERLKKEFDSRKQIDIDENEESAANFLEILKRGEKLRAQMEDALDEDKRTPWEQLHGVHNVPKTYVPPFLQSDFDKKQQDAKQDVDLNELEVMMDLPANMNGQNTEVNNEAQQSTADPQEPAKTKQIMDMRYIYIKIGVLRLDDQQLIQKCIDESFRLYVKVPLPDLHTNSVTSQNIQLNNYDVLSHNEYDFNSTSSFYFRINPETLAQFVDSSLIFCLQDQTIVGEVKMNKLMLASQFEFEHTCSLVQTIESKTKGSQYGNRGKKRGDQDAEVEQRVIGSISFKMKLQAENEEDEARRNFQLRLQQVEEEAAKQEAERAEMAKKKLQFVMEQAPVFGQLYLHVEKLGHADNIGKRSNEMLKASMNQGDGDGNIERDPDVVIMELEQEGLSSSLNARATGTDEDGAGKMVGNNNTDSLERGDGEKMTQKLAQSKKKVVQPKRNFYVKYKAFPNLEPMTTSTVWQKDADAIFNYRAQFPVMMTPETLEKMEKFVFVLELWDQVSPSVSEFLGLVKVPLAPITYSMKTTDEEIFSLNFMADQFCLYPMIVSDGFLPVYSPARGQNIGHLKLTLAMGSPIQINRLIAKEQEEEKRTAAEAERIRLLEAQRQIEQELREQERLKREQEKKEEEERRRKEEEEQKQANPLDSLLGLGAQTSATKRGTVSPAKLMGKNIAAVLRQSLNSQLSADYDQRERSMLNCMRKLFEEARSQSIEELNGDAIFKDDIKDFEGKVHKDEVIYTFLNHEGFSLTRAELAQIIQLMLDINRDDQGQIDVDELHFSFISYQKYYEIIEQRIVDLLDKFRISISKKFDTEESMQQLTADIESKATESKIALLELRSIIEDQHGVQIRDALFDQLLQFFDLDRDQQIYITSFCDYLKNPSSTTINFFKVNKAIISTQIADYVKNSIESAPDCILALEEEFKKEIWKNVKALQGEGGDPDELAVVPPDLLLKEKINAKLFQYKLKRQGIALSLWEVFTFFDYLNTNKAKMYFEPQRYHQVMFQHFFEFVKNQPYSRGQVNKPPGAQSRSRSRRSASRSRDRQDATDGEQPLAYDIGKAGYNRFPPNRDAQAEDEGYWHRNDLSDTEDPRQPYRQIKHIFEIKVQELKNIPILNKFICQMQNQSESLENQYLNEDMRKSKHLLSNKYIQNVAVKYSFPLDEDEILESDYLQLNKEALESQGVYNYTVSMDTVHTYVIGKDDKIRKVLELCQSRGGAQASGGYDEEHQVLNSQHARREELFNISIALYQDNREFIVGNAHLPIEDLIDTIEQYDNKTGTYSRKDKKTRLNRTIFLYGTSYSQRENCIIGKLVLDLQYSQEKLILSKKEAQAYALQQEKKENTIEEFNQSPFSCFMHRETYVNRKIPLNAKLSVLVDRVSNLKESIENIEHFARIQHATSGQGGGGLDNDTDLYGADLYAKDLSNLGLSSMVHGRKNMQHLDRRRVLKHILKNGLNLIVTCSVFEEDQELVSKFDTAGQAKTMAGSGVPEPPLGNLSRYKTRMLFNSLNPVFGEVFELNLQMNTKIFEYLKNKRAVFEVRHYIIESQKQKIDKLRRSQAYAADINDRLANDELDSQRTVMDDDVESTCDYLVLGYVRVPLIQLITKNNGVDGDFTIYDEFKQSMGSLKLRITLNHHNSQRPLYSTTNRIPDQVVPGISSNRRKQTIIEQSISFTNKLRTGQVSRGLAQKQKVIMGLDFVELLIKNRRQLTQQSPGQVSRFFLKYKFLNQVHQTRFLSSQTGNSLSPLNILLDKLHLQKLSIQKSNFIEIDVADQELVEEAFGKPLQIQLWHKVESVRTYEKPIKEQMLGQFFVELNELPQIVNRRLKSQEDKDDGQPGKFQVFEGYFSLHDAVKDVLSPDRLGMRLYLFKKDETNQTLNVDDMNNLFNTYRPKIEEMISLKLDATGKGYTDCDDLVQSVKDIIPDEYLAQKLIWFIKSSLQYKSVDKVFYSPLFGLPPPFFKYAKKFDQLEIVCKMNEELEQLDSGDHGFVPVNLFRNCLEEELNIKQKIVDDFVNGIRDTNIENSNAQSVTATVKEQQTLDVNMITNSLKTSHVDYIVMLRKLAQFIEQNKTTTNAASAVQSRILDSIKEHESAQSVTIYFEVDNGMRIRNPLSANEPPNAFVSMKPCFQYQEMAAEQFVQTSEIRANSYPTWNYRSKNFTMPLNRQNRQFLEDGGIIKFEVFHKASGFGHTDMELRESNHLIGVAFVPLKPLIEGSGRTRLTGLHDVISRTTIYNQSVQSLKSLDEEGVSMGKIKVSVTTSLNIRRMLDSEGARESGASPPKGTPYSPDFALSSALLDDPQKRNFSFGGNALSSAYANNPYPSQKQPPTQTNYSPTRSIASGLERSQPRFEGHASLGADHLEIGNLASANFRQLDDSVRSYHQTLQTKTEQELDHIHLANMNDLDDLTKKLKQSMAVLDATVPEQVLQEQVEERARSRLEDSPELSPHRRFQFGHQTFKTDAQQVTLSQQLNQYREASRQTAKAQPELARKEGQEVSNPFASYNENAFRAMGDLDRADAEDQPSYLKAAPLNQVAAVRQQEVETPELRQARDLASGERQRLATLEDGSDGTAAIPNVKEAIAYEQNAGRSQPVGLGTIGTSQKDNKSQQKAFDFDDMEDFDPRELERIEKILKQQL